MLDALISDLARISGTVLWRCTEGEEDNGDWGELRNALEAVASIMSPEDRVCVLDAVKDFDCRLSVKMIGRP
jgi:hypothetical protein